MASAVSKKAVILGVVLLAGGAAAWAYARQRAASGVSSDAAPAQPDYPVFVAPEFDPGAASFIDSINAWTQQAYTEIQVNTMPMPELPNLETNIAAMLSAIRESEGTARAGDPYRVCYAYKHTIASFTDHPAITGEWRGEPLSAAMCAGAGLGPGCVSTAAGAYQIVKPTWQRMKAKLGLADFGPASQDAAAVQLLKERGALAYLERGDFAGAVNAARKEWASLPGAGYGQGEKTIAWLTDKFTAAGGVLA